MAGGKEHFEDAPEQRPEWDPFVDTPSCEAQVARKTTKQSEQRFVYDFEGRKRDLGSDVIDQPGTEEAKIVCDSKYCGVLQILEAQGMGYAPHNQLQREVPEWLRRNCGKWQARIAAGEVSGEMPERLLPQKNN